MGRPCSICNHPKRRWIDAALSKGESLRDIAERFAVSKTSLSRHHTTCMAREKIIKIAKAKLATEKKQRASGKKDNGAAPPPVERKGKLNAYDSLVALQAQAAAIHETAIKSKKKNYALALQAISAQKGIIADMVKVFVMQQELERRYQNETPFEATFIYSYLSKNYPEVLKNLYAALKQQRIEG